MTEQRTIQKYWKTLFIPMALGVIFLIAIVVAATFEHYERLGRQEHLFQVISQLSSWSHYDTVDLPDTPETKDVIRTYYVIGWTSLGAKTELVNGFQKSADGQWTLPVPTREIYDESYGFDLVFIREMKGYRFTGQITPRGAWIHEMESFDIAPNAILESEPK